MAERKNTGIAVPDAKRLNDCYRELSEAIAARSARSGDRDLWQYDYAALPGGPEGDERDAWNHRCGSNDVALVALRGAVTNGVLPLWTYGPHGEAKVDRHELKEPTFRTFKSGTYQPDNRLLDSAGLADSPLWVKEADWHRYMMDLWTVRYGIDWANPAPPADAPTMPPEGQFVTLSHALTWIAFGVSMGNDHLHEVLSQDRYGERVPQDAIGAALDQLLASASGERVAIRGKYRANRDDDAAKLDTMLIEAIKFADYRQFSYLEDELRHGHGLLFWHNGSGQIFQDVFGSGRKDSYAGVTVNRADLLREFRPYEPMRREAEAIYWSDLEGPDLERVQQFARDAEADEWWNWPQAAAWVGGRNLEHIATMRLCAEPWKQRGKYDPAVALGAEHFLAALYSDDPVRAVQNLQRAIERGAIRTVGRDSLSGPSRAIEASEWRGGVIAYNSTADLISEADKLAPPWTYDIAISRTDLWTTFPKTPRCSSAAALPSQSQRRPGRAKGTGYQRADAPLLQRMAQAIASNPALNATSAAKLVADDAEGASFEAKVDRLSRAYRTGRNGE